MTKLTFDEYNFEVINVENSGNNLLTINKNSVTFDKSIAESLGYSSHVKPLVDREQRVFAIQACKASSLKGIPFSKPASQQKGSVKLQYSAIRNVLRALMEDEWKDEMRYQFKGTFIPEHKAMVFDLNNYEELPPFKPRNLK